MLKKGPSFRGEGSTAVAVRACTWWNTNSLRDSLAKTMEGDDLWYLSGVAHNAASLRRVSSLSCLAEEGFLASRTLDPDPNACTANVCIVVEEHGCSKKEPRHSEKKEIASLSSRPPASRARWQKTRKITAAS